MAGARQGPSVSRRVDQSSMPVQQQAQIRQQDDLFSPTSQLPNSQAAGFRFGSQNSAGRVPQDQNTGGSDFPALHNGAGEIGQDRTLNLLQNGKMAATQCPRYDVNCGSS